MLQIVTASLASFAHGSHEVANASGATSGVYQIWVTGGFTSTTQTPTWLLAYAGAGLSVGLLLCELARVLLDSPLWGFSWHGLLAGLQCTFPASRTLRRCTFSSLLHEMVW